MVVVVVGVVLDVDVVVLVGALLVGVVELADIFVVEVVCTIVIFSPNRPTGPIRSSSRNVRPCCVCCLLTPSHAIFLRGPGRSVPCP